jgi:hypothetical protein
MDQDVLVEGGAEGLDRIAEAFRSKGLPISGVYLTKLTSHDGFEEWIIRLIASARAVPDLKRQMIYALVELRRENKLPRIEAGVRFDIVDPVNGEASRIIEYTRRLGGAPALIRDTMWKGLFIEYALVASVPQADFVHA